MDSPATSPIDGSSTVAPLSSAAAEAFAGENSGVNITVGTSGTGGGFERFCAGETDISDASRAIDEEEVAACESGGVSTRSCASPPTASRSSRAPRPTSAATTSRWSSSRRSGARTPRSTTGTRSPAGNFNDLAAHPGGAGLAVGHLRLLQRGGPRRGRRGRGHRAAPGLHRLGGRQRHRARGAERRGRPGLLRLHLLRGERRHAEGVHGRRRRAERRDDHRRRATRSRGRCSST